MDEPKKYIILPSLADIKDLSTDELVQLKIKIHFLEEYMARLVRLRIQK